MQCTGVNLEQRAERLDFMCIGRKLALIFGLRVALCLDELSRYCTMKGKRKLKLGIMCLFVSQRAAARDVELARVLLCLENAAVGSGCGRMSPLLSGRVGEKGKEGWFWPDGGYVLSVRKACVAADCVLTKEASESPTVGVTERGAASQAGQ